MPTRIECTTSPSLLREIVADLTRPGHGPPSAVLDDLYHRHNGDLRACLRDLYDLYAQDDRI